MRVSQKVIRPVFFVSCYLQVSEFFYNITEGILILQYGLHLCQQSSSAFEKEHVLPPSEGCTTSSLATGIWHSAVPHHLYNGVLAGCLSKARRTGENLMVHVVRTIGWVCQHCALNFCDGLSCMHVYMW
jgi:hypothetical protein